MRAAWIAGLVALAGTNASALDLKLRCEGVVNTTQSESSTLNTYGDLTLNTTATTHRRIQTHDRMLVEITEAGGRVRLPQILVPTIHSGGSADGWWPMTALNVSETEISGKLTVNVFDKPSLRIDRTTGDVELRGIANTGFTGTCEVADPSARKF